MNAKELRHGTWALVFDAGDEAFVLPTLEVVLDEAPAHLRKRHDPESGLALIDLS